MSGTVRNQKSYSNKIINGETVNYSIAYLISVFVFIAVSQLFKTFLGVNETVSLIIGFAIAEIVLYFSERFFVYKNDCLNGNLTQAVFAVLGAGIHLGVYQLINIVFSKTLHKFEFTASFMALSVIFFINYFYSRILVFDCLNKAENKNGGRIYNLAYNNRFVILSAIVALTTMCYVYLKFLAFPFGDTTVLRMDLYHQYGPLFIELFDKITNFDSFIYSWTSGGGSSFIGNFFNYLSSPLNIFILLFDRDEMPFAITFLVALKCTLAASSFTFFLKKSFKKHSYISAAFGVLYAFSAYMLAYFWNIMWLDGMFILPLIALGIENIINKGKCKLYIFSLIYMLFANYYIGFMMCIFSVIYFIAYFLLICDKRTVVDDSFVSSKRFSIRKIYNNLLINRGIKFALSSLFVGGICALFLVPVFFILQSCSATSGAFPETVESYFTALDFIQSHFAGLETTIRSSGADVLPNIYSGVICLILVPLFVVNKKISFKDKIVYVALLIFFFISFNNNYANYIWHALHFPNDLPYRFSFMYSFILLIVSFKTITNIKGIGIKEIGFVSMFWIAFLAISQEMTTNKITNYAIYTTMAFVIIWCAVLFIIKKNKLNQTVLGVLIVAVTFCEAIISDTGAFNLNQKLTDYNGNYTNYTEAVDYLNKNDTSFYRAELCDLNTRMDPCIYGYRGISTFSSMAYENYSGLQYTLGMYGNRINSYTYHTQTPVYDMMFNIKYLIYNNQDVKPSLNLYTNRNILSDEETTIYENDYYLPIAYCTNSEVLDWIIEEGNPFDVQNEFFRLATGNENVFEEVVYSDYHLNGFSDEDIYGNGCYWLTKESDFAEIALELTASKSGNMYLYLTSDDAQSVTCTARGDVILQNIDTPYILDLGYFNEGETATVSLECSSGKSEICFEIYAYSLDTDVLNKGFGTLEKHSLDVSEYSNNHIAGTVNAEKNGVLYSSIPYDKGWSVYVDGEKAETFAIGNSLLCVNIEKGNHAIEYRYTPQGVTYGFAISAITLVSGIIYLVISKKLKKKGVSL